MKNLILLSLVVLAACAGATPEPAATPGPDLPSWNEGPAKARIEAFVRDVTDPQSPNFVPVGQRVATFDNDGTLWAEQPVYFQLFFVLDRIRAMAPDHPEWTTEEPWKSALAGDMKGVAAAGHAGLEEMLAATHSGMTTDEFAAEVRDWMATAEHPTSGRSFDRMIYAPMVELLRYLEAHDFTVFIVSGGGQDFMRPWAPETYGIPPHRIVGSQGHVHYEIRDDGPVLVKDPEIAMIDDKEGKPVGIHRFIGQRPVIAFGNSDGDFQMLEWTTSGSGPRFGALVHHTDAEREYAYDRESSVGRLDRGLDEAGQRGWLVVDMASDWSRVFPE